MRDRVLIMVVVMEQRMGKQHLKGKAKMFFVITFI
jgi:hypothetical protein